MFTRPSLRANEPLFASLLLRQRKRRGTCSLSLRDPNERGRARASEIEGFLSSRPSSFFFSGRTYYLVTSSGKTSFPLLPRSRSSPPPRTRSLPLPTESPPTPCPSASAPPPRTAKSSSSSSRPSPAPTPSGEASPTASRPSRGSRGRPRR